MDAHEGRLRALQGASREEEILLQLQSARNDSIENASIVEDS